jgi:DNA-binding NarL/FixJ family response regulator
MTTRISVLLADDHTIVIEGLRRVLETQFDVVGTVSDGRALVAAAATLKPDVIVADVSMPLLNGIEAARQIRQIAPHVKIVMLTMHPDMAYVSEALLAGASGYVLKTSAGTEILTAIREALHDRTYVTPDLDRRIVRTQVERESSRGLHRLPPRQREILQLIAHGQTTKEIAGLLNISSRTVEFHRYRAMKALGLHTIVDVVQYAIRHGGLFTS